MKRKPTMKDTFFMYGSLRRGMYNNKALEYGLKFISNAKLNGYKLVSFGVYPAIIPSDDGVVIGELFKITDKNVLEDIDAMEVNYGYKRTYKKVMDEFGHEQEVIFYEFENPDRCRNSEVVESGDWIKFKGEDKK